MHRPSETGSETNHLSIQTGWCWTVQDSLIFAGPTYRRAAIPGYWRLVERQHLDEFAAAHHQVPAVRDCRAVDARIDVASVLLGALQADRPRRVGERAVPDQDERTARHGGRLRRGYTRRRIARYRARSLWVLSGRPRVSAHRDAMRAVRDRDVEVFRMQASERVHGHPSAGERVGKTVPAQRHGMRMGRRRLHRPQHDEIDVDRKSTRLNSSHPSISYAVF